MRQKGPVEILCNEIAFRFNRHMERVDVLVAFVHVLVEHVAELRQMQQSISSIPGVLAAAPSAYSLTVLNAARAMVESDDAALIIPRAAEVHKLAHELNPDEKVPTDHLIDMLSSCASAIRFGLEKPCHSRHAAAAADHIWKHKYGLSLFDEYTPNWRKDWTRGQLQTAIFELAARGAAQ